MAATTLLLSKTDFEPYVDIAQFLADEYVDRELLAVQDLYLPALLGSSLYTALQTEKETANLTAVNTTLIQKLTPFLSYQTAYEYARTHSIQGNESGYRVQNNANDRPANDDEIGQLMNKYRDLATHHKRLFVSWLDDNEDGYPTLDRTDLRSSVLGVYKASGEARQNRISEAGGRQWI